MNVHEIIDRSIEENRWRERVLLGFSILFVGLGAFVLLWGLVHDSALAYAGIVESLLFVPAVLLVRTVSRETWRSGCWRSRSGRRRRLKRRPAC